MKLVCFDLDGVLVDSNDWHYESFNAAMQQLVGSTIGPEEHALHFNGVPTLKKVEMLIQQNRLPVGVTEQIVHLKAVRLKEMLREELEFDPVKICMIEQLKRDFLKVAVVSNSSRQNAELLLRGIGLLDKIDYLVSSSDVVAGKPSPEGYYKAMLYFAVTPLETFIFEDSEVGLTAAHASGANYFAVNSVEEVDYKLVARHI